MRVDCHGIDVPDPSWSKQQYAMGLQVGAKTAAPDIFTMRCIVALAAITLLFAASASAQGLSTTILVSCGLVGDPDHWRRKAPLDSAFSQL